MLKRGLVIYVILFILLSGFVSAEVAYVYKNERLIDWNVIDAFNDLGLNVRLIESNSLTDLENYQLIFIGNENFNPAELVGINKYPILIMNSKNLKELGLVTRVISRVAGNAPLKIRENGQMFTAYTDSKDRRRINLPYYYIKDEYKACEMKSVVSINTGQNFRIGDVVSYINEGTILGNGKRAEENICFFGIVKSNFWTEDARKLFTNCISFVLDEEDIDEDDDEDMDEEENNTSSPTIEEVREALEKYKNVSIAEQEGYVSTIECVEDAEIGAMGIHYYNPSLASDYVINPLMPELLLYIPVEDELRLVAAEYFMPSNNPPVFGSTMPESFLSAPTVFGQTFNGPMQGHEEGQPWHYDLHVWLWEENPNGLFAQYNPNLMCPSNDENEENETETPSEIHDVGFKNFSNSINGIRLEFTNGTDILDENFACGERYRVSVTIENKGNFSENVSFEGNVGDVEFQHIAIENFEIGDSSLKTRTVTFPEEAGTYRINIQAIIDNDSHIEDNSVSRNVQVIC